MAEEVTVIEPKPLMGARGGARGGPMGMKRGIFLNFCTTARRFDDSPSTVFCSHVAKPAFALPLLVHQVLSEGSRNFGLLS
jgi:hypothetical protein